ncbi:MAG: SEC-C metal-binding domain-containing protein [Deltaproteobacteria bacterium]
MVKQTKEEKFNALCPCGSGKKYGDCCGGNEPCCCGSGKKASECCYKKSGKRACC